MRWKLAFLAFFAVPCVAQNTPIDQYIQGMGDYPGVATVAPATRNAALIDNILPKQQSQRFARYVETKIPVDAEGLRQAVGRLQLNKLLVGTGGATGVTSLVSRVATPAVLGLGVEYGGILQNTNGTVTTLRANLLGVSRMALGGEQFPNCVELGQAMCDPKARWLRRFSGALAFENATAQTGTGSADTGVPGSPAVADLFGNDFRMSSWGLRFDFTATNPDDPAFTARWTEAIQKLRGSSASLALTQSVSDLIEDEDGNIDPVYEAWEASARTALQAASVADFKQVLQNQLDLLIASEILAHPDFMQRIGTLNIAFSNYTEERDALLKEIQSHRFTFEYTNQHPRNAPNTSNARFIYSHQPFEKVPVLLTANAGFTWYNADPATAGAGRLRDVQFAGQLDRRLGQIGNFGNAVLTFSGYYQWMKEDALINIGPGSIAPGSGIVLPGAAAKLLGTKGHIGIVQGKVSIPVGDVVKIPFSLTWSNRTELIKKEDLRGQVGIAFDIDSLFR